MTSLAGHETRTVTLKILESALIALLGCAGSSAAWSWGPAGHETVGALADALIAGSPAAAQVTRILGTNLQTASVWADCAKGVAEHDGRFAYGGKGHYPECAPYETDAGMAEMVAYVERNWDGCHPAANEDVCHKQYHYSDVAVERNKYTDHEVGTSDHDVEAAIVAAIVYLKTGKNTAPIDFATQREALRVLAHLVGDIHQPLHVGAIYLDASGREVDPDIHGLDPTTQTRGGNQIKDGTKNLHAEWDSVSTSLNATHLGRTGVVLAGATAVSEGLSANWSKLWATDTLASSKLAFGQLKFAAEDDSTHTWVVTLPVGYARARSKIQRQQLLKAGGRLAQVLKDIFPT